MKPRRPGTRMRTNLVAVAVVAASMISMMSMAACSNDQQLADVSTIAPRATDAASTSPTDVAGSSTSSASEPVPETTETSGTGEAGTVPATTPPIATDAGSAVTGPRFSDALGVEVDTAPGVNTPGDTRQLLPEGLYVHIAWAADPNDPSVFTVQPADVEILEAYANAVAAYYSSATNDLDAETEDLQRYVVSPREMFGRAFAEALEGGFVLTLGNGVVLRPYIVSHEEGAATVYDCYLQDEAYITRGSDRGGGALKPKGQVATVRLVDGSWKVDTAGLLGSACL